MTDKFKKKDLMQLLYYIQYKQNIKHKYNSIFDPLSLHVCLLFQAYASLHELVYCRYVSMFTLLVYMLLSSVGVILLQMSNFRLE